MLHILSCEEDNVEIEFEIIVSGGKIHRHVIKLNSTWVHLGLYFTETSSILLFCIEEKNSDHISCFFNLITEFEYGFSFRQI